MTLHYWERKQSIDHLFSIIDAIIHEERTDNEVKSCLAKYLCVVVSGFLETSIRDIYSDYAENKSHENVTSFVTISLKSFQSPKMGNILLLTEAFSGDWKLELEKKSIGEIKDSIDSLVDNRHHIAHGRDVGITYDSIKKYYKNTVKLLKLIEDQCNS
jgi:hypothetical protein